MSSIGGRETGTVKGATKFLAIVAVALACVSPVPASDLDGDGVDDTFDVCNNTSLGTAIDTAGRPLGDLDNDCDTDLRDFAQYEESILGDFVLFNSGITGPLAPAPFVIETVAVGNPGNTGQLSGDSVVGPFGFGGDRICGAVDYAYNIGKFEVTARQYTEFLNAVAGADTYWLYNASMWSDDFGCKIQRTGASPHYEYSVASDWSGRPVNYVSWGDAARFANWLHNRQPTGAQDLGTTEDGSYFLNGATSDAELIAIVREPDATWVIPSEDEWYKAAYHLNDGVTGNYVGFPMSHGDHEEPSNCWPGDGGNNANFNVAGQFTIGSPYYRTVVGDFFNSASPYDTFDQGGNVWEWHEGEVAGLRGIRGGAFNGLFSYAPLHADGRYDASPASEGDVLGFRVAEVP